jgi:hypothetical protein
MSTIRPKTTTSPYEDEEFENILEVLADYEDLRDLREAKESDDGAPGVSLSDVRKQLGI